MHEAPHHCGREYVTEVREAILTDGPQRRSQGLLGLFRGSPSSDGRQRRRPPAVWGQRWRCGSRGRDEAGEAAVRATVAVVAAKVTALAAKPVAGCSGHRSGRGFMQAPTKHTVKQWGTHMQSRSRRAHNYTIPVAERRPPAGRGPRKPKVHKPYRPKLCQIRTTTLQSTNCSEAYIFHLTRSVAYIFHLTRTERCVHLSPHTPCARE